MPVSANSVLYVEHIRQLPRHDRVSNLERYFNEAPPHARVRPEQPLLQEQVRSALHAAIFL